MQTESFPKEHSPGENRKASKVAFDGERLWQLSYSTHWVTLGRKARPRRERACPVVSGPPSLPLPPQEPLQRKPFSPTAPCPLSGCDEGLGQEAEDRKQQKQEGGQEEADETPASSYSALPAFRIAKQCFQKYLHESKLMKHYISSDNGRMWGWLVQAEKINAISTRGCSRGLRLGEG